MGVFGEIFPGKKLADEGTGDTDGQQHPRLDLDLDAGVIRLSGPSSKTEGGTKDESAE